MNFEGWAIFMDCDMLCFSDIGELWEQRDDKYSLLCVKHNHKPQEKKSFKERYNHLTQKKIGVH